MAAYGFEGGTPVPNKKDESFLGDTRHRATLDGLTVEEIPMASWQKAANGARMGIPDMVSGIPVNHDVFTPDDKTMEKATKLLNMDPKMISELRDTLTRAANGAAESQRQLDIAMDAQEQLLAQFSDQEALSEGQKEVLLEQIDKISDMIALLKVRVEQRALRFANMRVVFEGQFGPFNKRVTPDAQENPQV